MKHGILTVALIFPDKSLKSSLLRLVRLLSNILFNVIDIPTTVAGGQMNKIIFFYYCL